MHLPKPLSRLTWLAAAALCVACSGCATTQLGAGTPPSPWPMDEAARTAKRLEQQKLMAVLQRLSATGDAYDRLTEAGSSIIDTVSWWGSLASPATPPSPPVEPTTDAADSAPLDDPYAELDSPELLSDMPEPKRP